MSGTAHKFIQAWQGSRMWILALLLALMAVYLIIGLLSRLPKPNRNALAVGPEARADAVEIGILTPVELDGKTRDEALRLRRQAALMYPDMLAGAYQPSEAVFGQIDDGSPWWGTVGQFYHGSGQQSIEGPSEETRFILNPYLLVAAEFNGLSIWARTGEPLVWDKGRVTGGQAAQPDFPLYCDARTLSWRPREARAEVVYDLSAYIRDASRWTARPLSLAQASFDVIAYNAWDFNLNHLRFSPEDSVNVQQVSPSATAVAISQYLHRGSSCGYPGGCNNMSPRVRELEGFRIQRLPARAVFYLWREKPLSADQPPDVVFALRFE